MRKIAVALAFLIAFHVPAAHAYIGPGAGAGTIAIVFGVISSIFLGFVGLLWYPFKRLFRKLKKKPPTTGT